MLFDIEIFGMLLEDLMSYMVLFGISMLCIWVSVRLINDGKGKNTSQKS